MIGCPVFICLTLDSQASELDTSCRAWLSFWLPTYTVRHVFNVGIIRAACSCPWMSWKRSWARVAVRGIEPWNVSEKMIMKTIGLLGGMTWHSSLEYYRIINKTIQARLGGSHSARCLLYSVEFEELDALERENRWEETVPILVGAAQSLERGGADFVVICSNTTHKLSEPIQDHLHIPILHIADATARAIQAAGFQRVGLLGTRFTMEEDFIRGRLIRDYGLEVIIPALDDREIVHRVIYDEFTTGQFLECSRLRYTEIMGRLVDSGAEAIILGCTEIGLLVHPEDCSVPLLDTTQVHAAAAVDYALAE